MSRYGRSEERFDHDSLRNKKVLCIGLGSMAIPCLYSLVRMGLACGEHGALFICDGDDVEERNITCSSYNESHLGENKAEMAKKLLEAIDRNVKIEYSNTKVTDKDGQKLIEYARGLDSIFLFADDFEMMHALSIACYEHCSMVQAMFGRNCDVSRVAYSIPFETCRLDQAFGENQGRRASGSDQGLGLDTMLVSNYVSRVCASVLLKDSPGELRRGLPALISNACMRLIVLRSANEAQLPEGMEMAVYLVGTQLPRQRRRR